MPPHLNLNALLDALSDANASTVGIADRFDLTVTELADILDHPLVAQAIKALDKVAAFRERIIAAQTRPEILQSLAFNATRASASPETQRKAASLLAKLLIPKPATPKQASPKPASQKPAANPNLPSPVTDGGGGPQSGSEGELQPGNTRATTPAAHPPPPQATLPQEARTAREEAPMHRQPATRPPLTTCTLLPAALASPALADVINVPADQSTIQAAIPAASPGDEILLAPGTDPVTTLLSIQNTTLSIHDATANPADLVPQLGTRNIDDVLVYLTAFASGCP